MAIEQSVEERIKAFINTFSPEEITVAKRIMFYITNKDLINKVKKIYEQPKPTDTGDIATDSEQ